MLKIIFSKYMDNRLDYLKISPTLKNMYIKFLKDTFKIFILSRIFTKIPENSGSSLLGSIVEYPKYNKNSRAGMISSLEYSRLGIIDRLIRNYSKNYNNLAYRNYIEKLRYVSMQYGNRNRRISNFGTVNSYIKLATTLKNLGLSSLVTNNIIWGLYSNLYGNFRMHKVFGNFYDVLLKNYIKQLGHQNKKFSKNFLRVFPTFKDI
jgi:hypothetical protein